VLNVKLEDRMLKLSCMICGKKHKARSDKFPLPKYEKRDDKVVLVGHICKWCIMKDYRKK
jgi:hypothetical protein